LASNSLDDVPSAEGAASNSLNKSVLVTDNPHYHATPNDLLDESLGTTVGSLNPAVQSGDFKKVVELMQQRALFDDEKYYLLTSHFNPDSEYRFPSSGYDKQKCSFQHSWLSCYNGLVYSECGKGRYCKYCVLFGKATYSMSSFTGVLTDCPLTNVQKASQKLRDQFEGLKTEPAKKISFRSSSTG